MLSTLPTLSTALLTVLALAHPPAPAAPGAPAAVTVTVPGNGPAAPAGVRPGRDALRDLENWMRRQRRSLDEDDPGAEEALRELLSGLRVLRKSEPERAQELDLALLDLAGLGWISRAARAEVRAEGGRDGWRSLHGLERFERRLLRDDSGDLERWLALEVLARPDENPVQRRIVAADLLLGRFVDGTRTALFAASADEDEILADTAQRALAGWPHPEVHYFFLERLEREKVSSTVALDHLMRTRDSLGDQALDRLADLVRTLLASTQWRQAIQGSEFVAVLDSHRAAPILLDALELWTQRLADGEGSRRVQHEINRELQRISGRTIGPVPERWRLWWKAVEEGRLETVEDAEAAGGGVSSAQFFGIRPVTDRVVFVIDRSGSMEATFGTGDRTRYEEAVEQLIACIQGLGDDTRFGITLFNHKAKSWRRGLVTATPENLSTARKWLLGKKPDGGTQLWTGIEEALELDRRGRIDVDRLEADTVIVLCDGATAEGKRWVRPWLDRCNGEARLVFHCVEIGNSGDGTLEALASGTGGDFARIEG